MKFKKIAKTTSVLSLFVVPLLAIGATNVIRTTKEANAATTVTTDYNAFMVRSGSVGAQTVDSKNNSITYQGTYDGNLLVTDQFNTRAGNYSLKTHVENSSWVSPTSSDTGTGFCIYYNDSNFITFYMKWENSGNTIHVADWLNHVNGSVANVYQSAICPSEDYVTRGQWTDLWADNSSVWLNAETNEGLAPKGNTTIAVNKGFDMTINVERATYKDRLADLIWVQIDAYDSTGTNKLSVKTVTYAIDAMTNPFGKGESDLVNRKPQLGFIQYNSTATFSNIVFTDKSTVKKDVQIDVYGATPEVATIDSENQTIKYSNSNFTSGLLMAEVDVSSTDSVDLQATVSGTQGNINDTQLGFAYYFDDSNYGVIYLKWDGGSNGTLAGISLFFNVNGQSKNASQWAKTTFPDSDEGKTFQTNSEFLDCWSDFGGWSKDSEEPMYDNFNNMRNESAITISSDFTFGLQRTRITYLNRVVDAFQIRVTANDVNGVLRTWYSPRLAIDAYTYPFGGTASAYLNKSPKIGFYSCHAGEITLSNIKYNGKSTTISEYYSATDFANDLLDKTNDICANSEDKKTELTPVWEELKNNCYSKLSEAEKTTLKETEGVYGSSSSLERAMDRYDYIVTKYGLDNFIAREVSTSNRQTLIFNNGSQQTTAVVIIIVGVVSASLIAGIAFINKRKEKKN